MMILVLALTITWILSSPAAAAPPTLPEAARTLADNVLGAGSVTAIRTSDDGTQVLMRWESPTYRQANHRSQSRESIYGEAVLATNAILGRLHRVTRIRFAIFQGRRMLATGESIRGRGVTLRFSLALGGDVYVPPEPRGDRKAPTRGAAQEI